MCLCAVHIPYHSDTSKGIIFIENTSAQHIRLLHQIARCIVGIHSPVTRRIAAFRHAPHRIIAKGCLYTVTVRIGFHLSCCKIGKGFLLTVWISIQNQPALCIVFVFMGIIQRIRRPRDIAERIVIVGNNPACRICSGCHTVQAVIGINCPPRLFAVSCLSFGHFHKLSDGVIDKCRLSSLRRRNGNGAAFPVIRIGGHTVHGIAHCRQAVQPVIAVMGTVSSSIRYGQQIARTVISIYCYFSKRIGGFYQSAAGIILVKISPLPTLCQRKRISAFIISNCSGHAKSVCHGGNPA